MKEQGGEKPDGLPYEFIDVEALPQLFSPQVLGEFFSAIERFNAKKETDGEAREQFSRGRCHWNFAIIRNILKRSRIRAIGWKGLKITDQAEKASPSHKVGAIYRNGRAVLFDITPSQYAPINPTLNRDILLVSCPRGKEEKVLAEIYGGLWQPVSFRKS